MVKSLNTDSRDPHKIDLRFFRRMTLTDSWSGEGTTHNGLTRNLLFYDGRRVYCEEVFRVEGSTESRQKSGDNKGFWRRMEGIANAYMHILRYTRVVTKVDVDNSQVGDTIFLEKKDLAILLRHPQVLEMEKEFAAEGYGVTVQKMKMDSNEYRILVKRTAIKPASK